MTSPNNQPFLKESVVVGYDKTIKRLTADRAVAQEFRSHLAEAERFMERGSVDLDSGTHLPMVVIDLSGDKMPSTRDVRDACTLQWGTAPNGLDSEAFSAPVEGRKDFGVLVLEKSNLVVLYLPTWANRQDAEDRVSALGEAVQAQVHT